MVQKLHENNEKFNIKRDNGSVKIVGGGFDCFYVK